MLHHLRRAAAGLAAITLGALSAFVCPADAGWVSLPNGPVASPAFGRHDDVFFVSPDSGWVVNGAGEIHRTTERFGNIAHVLSTYESRTKLSGPVIARGINSIELFWDGTRWWIASAIWDDERPDNPIPAQYLPAATPSTAAPN